MANQMHPMERRSKMLADALGKRISTMAALMRPDGRPIYHQRLNEQQALQFWRRHRFDDLGASVLSTWTPDQILQLDQVLQRASESEGFDGGNIPA